MRRHPGENDTSAGERLGRLTEYAVKYRYQGAEVIRTAEAIVVRIRTLSAGEEDGDGESPAEKSEPEE